ncbi:9610_t:CDS:1, partial [Cetraspora pellucida]
SREKEDKGKNKESNNKKIELETGSINNEEDQQKPAKTNQQPDEIPGEVIITEANQVEVSEKEEKQSIITTEKKETSEHLETIISSQKELSE